MLSAYTEEAAIERNRRLRWLTREVPTYAVPTAIYAFLLIPLVRRRKRSVAVSVLVLCLVLTPLSYGVFEIAVALLPEEPPPKPSYAYLDDYVQIDGIQFTSPDDVTNTTIAGYDIRSFQGDGRRIVAFANTHVRAMGDVRARALFEANGLEYPVKADTNPDG
jgi:hypothetical protein